MPHTLHPSVFPPLIFPLLGVFACCPVSNHSRKVRPRLCFLYRWVFFHLRIFSRPIERSYASAAFHLLFPCTYKETRKKCKAHHSCFCGKKSLPCSFSQNQTAYFLWPWWKSFWSPNPQGFLALSGFGLLTHLYLDYRTILYYLCTVKISLRSNGDK